MSDPGNALLGIKNAKQKMYTNIQNKSLLENKFLFLKEVI
jgi:hypothetical protein